MLGTRQLARLIEATFATDAKLVLVGDHRQLPELAAGGTFRALARDLSAVQLNDNRRQAEAWERGALDKLRSGDVAAALETYAMAGCISIGDTAEEQRRALVNAWWDTTRHGDMRKVVMIAHRRADVADLNRLARARLMAEGQLLGSTVYGVDEHESVLCFAAGDVVVVRRNDYREGLINGQRGVVAAIDERTGGLRLRIADKDMTVSAVQLGAGGLDHGYAITVHQAQGLTVDRALLLGSAAMYREAGYVGMSRGRQKNQLFLTDQADDLAYNDDDLDQARQPSEDRPDAMTTAVNIWQRTRAQATARDMCR